MESDVAHCGSPEQGITQCVNHRVAIGVSNATFRVGDSHATERKGQPFGELMDVVAVADTYVFHLVTSAKMV